MSSNIIKYWAKTQLYYRQPEGEKAADELNKLIGNDGMTALMFITGFLSGCDGNPSIEQLEKLAEESQEM